MFSATAHFLINWLFAERYFDNRVSTAHLLSLCTYFRLKKRWVFATGAKKQRSGNYRFITIFADVTCVILQVGGGNETVF